MSENSCPNIGSIHDDTSNDPKPYVAPEFCIPEYELTKPGCDNIQEQYAAENLEISGAPVNVFKLLGVHEQGRLVDLVGDGTALNSSTNAFTDSAISWISRERGIQVLTGPSWIGYDFGIKKTSYGAPAYEPFKPNDTSVSSLRIVQPSANRRALQIRIERSDGDFSTSLEHVIYSCSGNGKLSDLTIGQKPNLGSLMLIAVSPDTFNVFFTGAVTETVGVLTVGKKFMCQYASFTIAQGTIPFSSGDMISVGITMRWERVDVVNLPNVSNSSVVRFNKAKPSRYWRIVPTSFAGVQSNDFWEVAQLEFFDYELTRLDDIQDHLLMENRDRDYAKSSIQIKAAYTAVDTVTDFSKFGFNIGDSLSFTTTFATMVKALGRPIVIGDIIEIPSEMQYDQNLRPVRKFLEVVDTGWAADGHTLSWRPIIFKFQGSPFMASQEHRDILGTAETQLYQIDDSDFFGGVKNQIQTQPIVSAKINQAEATDAVPERGVNLTEVASGVSPHNPSIEKYDGAGNYVEDGIPPDGAPYTEGFTLPDVQKSKDGQYFRLLYDPKLNIQPRLYKFSLAKGKWIYLETDRRTRTTSHKPSQNEIFNNTTQMGHNAKTIPRAKK